MPGSSMLVCGGEHWNAHLRSWDDSSVFRRCCSSRSRGCARHDRRHGPQRLLGISRERIGKCKSTLLGQLQGSIRPVSWRCCCCGSSLQSGWRQRGQRHRMLGTASCDSASWCCCGCRHARGTVLEEAPVAGQGPRHSPFQDCWRRAAAGLDASCGSDPLPLGMALGKCLQDSCASASGEVSATGDSVIRLQHEQHSIWRSAQHRQAEEHRGPVVMSVLWIRRKQNAISSPVGKQRTACMYACLSRAPPPGQSKYGTLTTAQPRAASSRRRPRVSPVGARLLASQWCGPSAWVSGTRRHCEKLQSCSQCTINEDIQVCATLGRLDRATGLPWHVAGQHSMQRFW